MSDSKENKEKDMLLRLIEIEAERNRDFTEDKLSAEDKAKLISRIRVAQKQVVKEYDQQEENQTARSSVSLKIWLPALAAIVVLGIGVSRLFNVFTSPKQKVMPEIAFATGEVRLLTGAETHPAKLGAMMPFEAVLSTGTKALAVAAWSTADAASIVTVALGQEASLQTGLPTIEGDLLTINMTQLKGRVAYEVKPGRAKLLIQTPTANIEVVGTSFTVGVSSEGTTIMVSSGSVEVKTGTEFTRDITGENRYFLTRRVSAREKVQVRSRDNGLILMPIADEEKTMLAAFEAMTSLSNTPATARHMRYQTLGTKLIEAEIKLEFELNTVANPREGARGATAPAGKMSIVTTKSGKSYTGFYSHKGEYAEIRTASGIEKIPVDEIQDVRDKD